ncbi:MAG TPA: hypothetical protein VLX31_12480 [Streptosporangiaceae bacterium]|nr:hypothetical protein [Streptosporangiaceae bacterium]
MAGPAFAAVVVAGSVLGASLAGCASGPSRANAASNAWQSVVSSGIGGTALTAMLGNPASVKSVSVAATGSGNDAAGQSAVPAAASLRGCAAAARRLLVSGHRPAARGAWHACLRRYLRLRLWLRHLLIGGLHGQFTITTVNGIKTFAFERGTIQSVAGSSVVVRASDGTTWTWSLDTTTLITKSGQSVPASSLATGQQIFVAGPVVSGADDARRILIRP